MWVFKSIAEHLDLDFRQSAVALFALVLIIGILGLIVGIEFGVWRLAHPDAPWWTWMF